jgi:hypothetical protein
MLSIVSMKDLSSKAAKFVRSIMMSGSSMLGYGNTEDAAFYRATFSSVEDILASRSCHAQV